jgi:predicted flap endonuclease-1-like 5' DNA nuclease
MNLPELVSALDQLMVAGQFQQAVDDYFHPEAIFHSNRYDRIVGKAAKQQQVARFVQHIAQIELVELQSSAVNGNVSLSEFTFAFRWHDGSSTRYAEVIRRKWHDGQVIDEKYYTGHDTDDTPDAAFIPATAYTETETNFPKKTDNLEIIEGIGPKIAGLLIDAGITTFGQLANTPTDDIKAILTKAGPRYRLADCSTWPQQSQLAADGNRDALKKLQGELRAGKMV